jgi:hypothetical protein
MSADDVGMEGPELIRAAAEAGYTVSERTLEVLRFQGLVPGPVREGNRGRRPVWRYPFGAELQLISLLAWREHTKNPNVLSVLLWLNGFTIAPDTVRKAVSDWLTVTVQTLEREVEAEARRRGLDPVAQRGEVVTFIASGVAGKRGPGAVPRRVRVTAAERSGAVEQMLRLFAFGETVEATEQDAAVVEKVLGVSPGRRQRVNEAGPWLTGPALDLFDAAEVVALPKMVETMAQATDAELEAARPFVAGMFRILPLIARMIGAVFGDNHAGMAGLGQLDDQPDIAVMMVPMFIGMIRAGWQENLEAVAAALGPIPELADSIKRILEMSSTEIAHNLQGQPAEVQRSAQRLIDAALDGRLDESPRRLER